MSDTARIDMDPMPSKPVSAQSSIELACMYAQKLNNNAALCIGCGQYQRAEASLTKAMHLSKMYIQQSDEKKICSCSDCTVDGCILSTEDSGRTKRKRKRSELSIAERDFSNHSMLDSIYRRPIQVPNLQTTKGHTRGKTLSLIIVFNMGLASHLRAIKANSPTERRNYLEKSRRLYEIAYTFLQQGKISNESIQFRMILCNNLYHVNQHLRSFPINDVSGFQDDLTRSVQQKYLDELLSTLLCIVERKFNRSSSDNNSNQSHFIGKSTQTRFINLEGFWKTVDQLVLKSHCAHAA